MDNKGSENKMVISMLIIVSVFLCLIVGFLIGKGYAKMKDIGKADIENQVIDDIKKEYDNKDVDNKSENNGTQGINNDANSGENSESEDSILYEENMIKDLKNKILNENYKFYFQTCTDNRNPETPNMPNFQTQDKEIPLEKLDVLLNKLKNSISITKKETAEAFCPEVYIRVCKDCEHYDDVLAVYYYGKDIYIGYNNGVKEYKYNEDTKSFLKSLGE